MATPLSEDVEAVLGAVAAGGSSHEDDQRHVQRARACIHDIMGTIIGGSTKASMMHMVGEGDSPHLWLLRAQLDAVSCKWMVWKTLLQSLVLNGDRVVPASTAAGPAAASGLAAALLGAWGRLGRARQLTMTCCTAAASFGWTSELHGVAFGRDLWCPVPCVRIIVA